MPLITIKIKFILKSYGIKMTYARVPTFGLYVMGAHRESGSGWQALTYGGTKTGLQMPNEQILAASH